MLQHQILEAVKEQLSTYLVAKKLRKTPERFAILEQIYSLDDHFDVETLYELMLTSGYRVSRATVYNTVDLLVECRLIIRHQFNLNVSHYEKAFNEKNHYHLICICCNHVQEVEDEEVNHVIKGKQHPGFNMTNYNLYIYGKCHECMAASCDDSIHS